MEAMEAILTRRSVRRYTAEPVSEADLRRLLEAAMSAPSANNQQPWQFVVIDERQVLDAIPGFHPYSNMLKTAPAAVLVCGDRSRAPHSDYWVQDCSAATQNLLIAARASGLGAVWLGIYPLEARVDGMRSLLGLPAHVVPLALVSLGHPDVAQEPVDRFDAGRIHRNRW